jgi:hypothetical protein
MKIWEQVDISCGCGRDECRQRYSYSWMISRGYATRAEMIRWGWKWIAGRPRGLFVTNDPAAVNRARDVMRLDAPESNGTHDRIGAPMHAVHAARERVRAEYAVAGLVADAEIEGFEEMTPHELFAEITYISDYQG